MALLKRQPIILMSDKSLGLKDILFFGLFRRSINNLKRTRTPYAMSLFSIEVYSQEMKFYISKLKHFLAL